MELFFADLRYGLRMLRKSPGWTAVMSATLALGIGLSTAIFSLTYSILLRALPYPNSERLVTLWTTSATAAAANVSRFNAASANWIDWRSQSTVFEDIALTRAANFNLTGDGSPQRLQGGRASWNLPQVLGLQPLRGRMLTEEECRGNAKVAVLSYGFWERHYARDPAVIGRSIQLNGESFEVIGVMPADFQHPTKDVELWTPLFISPDEIVSRLSFNYRAVGRLKQGVTLQQAQAEMSGIMQSLAQQYPASNGAQQLGVLLEPLLDTAIGQFRMILYVLLAAVGSLLLIGCINLGGLLMVHASARTQEFSIRAALGASTSRLIRQTLAEVLPLSVVGVVGGVFLTWLLLKVLVLWLPPQLPGIDSIGLHLPVLVFALVVSVLIVLLAGILPARMASRVQIAETMKKEARTVAGGAMVRNILVVAQIAVTLVLVFAGGLLLRSLVAVMNVNPGFSPEGVLTMQLAVTPGKYPTNPQIADYYRRLIDRVKTVPGVLEAGMISLLPLSEGRLSGPVYFEGKLDGGWIGADSRSVTPGYFSAMGISLTSGRIFSEQDKEGTPRVSIIDEQLALLVFGDEDPLGKRIRFGVVNDKTPWVEIVGVVKHIRNDSLETDLRPQVYWPEAQQTLDRGALVVKTASHPETFVSAVVEQIQLENPDQPVYDVRSMGARLEQSLQSRNLLTGLVSLFGGSSLLLAGLGLYGVVSYTAVLRLREFAVRMALGAQPGDVSRLVLRYAGGLGMLGSAIGLLVAWPVGRALRSLLYGVGSADLITLVIAPGVLLLIALLAGIGPAFRASRVDPAVMLRGE